MRFLRVNLVEADDESNRMYSKLDCELYKVSADDCVSDSKSEVNILQPWLSALKKQLRNFPEEKQRPSKKM